MSSLKNVVTGRHHVSLQGLSQVISTSRYICYEIVKALACDLTDLSGGTTQQEQDGCAAEHPDGKSHRLYDSRFGSPAGVLDSSVAMVQENMKQAKH